ncbi:nucleotidyltransferase family protein [uncultured Microbacterium sp.]|uniref:nucleotidyltransferase family protein n=1 Tax=uncultured Microbacterium sp. TaxID=191216 RepID=UPI0035CB0C61
MSTDTSPSLALRELIDAHRDELDAVLAAYGATNARVFGSVARGEATETSDLDILVDLLPDHVHSRLLRVSGVAAGFEAILHRDVDVVAAELMRDAVGATALADATPL